VSGDGTGSGRGFSTPASFLIVFIGLFLALGSLYTATANTAERRGDASADQREHHDRIAATSVNVTSATWDITNSNFTVWLNNTGDTTLHLGRVDTVVDGSYVPVSAYERVEVDGRESDLWRPGEQLVLEDADTITEFATTPDHVKVVTGPGVGAAAEVTDG
jgi:flagellar protein FlaF